MQNASRVAEDQALDESQVEAALARSNVTAVDERLRAVGLRRFPLPADGDCFFHLLAHNGLAATAAAARAEVLTTLEQEWDAIALDTGCPDPKQARIARMRAPSSLAEGFAEREEVLAAARRYDVCFHIFSPWDDSFVGSPDAAGAVICATYPPHFDAVEYDGDPTTHMDTSADSASESDRTPSARDDVEVLLVESSDSDCVVTSTTPAADSAPFDAMEFSAGEFVGAPLDSPAATLREAVSRWIRSRREDVKVGLLRFRGCTGSGRCRRCQARRAARGSAARQ